MGSIIEAIKGDTRSLAHTSHLSVWVLGCRASGLEGKRHHDGRNVLGLGFRLSKNKSKGGSSNSTVKWGF